MKTCPDCGFHQPDAAFYRDKSRRDGLSGTCKSCKTQRSKLVHKVGTCKKFRPKEPELKSAKVAIGPEPFIYGTLVKQPKWQMDEPVTWVKLEKTGVIMEFPSHLVQGVRG